MLQHAPNVLQINIELQHILLNLLQLMDDLLQIKVPRMQINVSAHPGIHPRGSRENRALQIKVDLQRGEPVLLPIEDLLLQMKDAGRPGNLALLQID